MARQVMVLVGTKKAGFIYTSDEKREKWEISEPILPGWTFFNMSADTRDGNPRLYAAANHWAWGRSVAKSTDMGKTWDIRSENLAFPPDMKDFVDSLPKREGPIPGDWANTAPGTIGNIWAVSPGHESQPGVVFAGTQPAGLFKSEDWGQSWQPVESINRHANRRWWSGTGGGDSCIHSIHIDPRDANHIYLCVASGGTYESKDNGQTWDVITHKAVVTNTEGAKLMQQLVQEFPSELPPGMDPAAIDELHKMRLDPKNPDRIWGQAHMGVFRSDDAGATWSDVTEGLPSFHGFPIAVTHHNPDAAFVVPLDYGQDNFRVALKQFTVYRTRDSGKSWEPLTNGLPGPNDYQSVYREGLDTDGLDSEGVYVGTSNGEVFYGAECGERWTRLPGTLPPVLSVTAAVV
ncbi:MAG TPA: sialidase family protein [Dehalococcoidia bacterium]|nr:sialidase family protein [Dehalococcoidia bacterium]